MSRNKKRIYEPGDSFTVRTRKNQTKLIEFLNKSETVSDDVLTALEQFYGITPKQPANMPVLDVQGILPLIMPEVERLIAKRTAPLETSNSVPQSHSVSRNEQKNDTVEETTDTTKLNGNEHAAAAEISVNLTKTNVDKEETQISTEEMFAVLEGLINID